MSDFFFFFIKTVHIFCSRKEDLSSLQSFLSPLQTLSLSGSLHIQLSSDTSQEGGDRIGWAMEEVMDNCRVSMNLQVRNICLLVRVFLVCRTLGLICENYY